MSNVQNPGWLMIILRYFKGIILYYILGEYHHQWVESNSKPNQVVEGRWKLQQILSCSTRPGLGWHKKKNPQIWDLSNPCLVMAIGYPCLRGVNLEMWDLNLLTSSSRHLNIGDLADDLTTVCGAFFSRSSLMKSGFSCIKRYAPLKFKMEPGKGSWTVILLLDKGLVGLHCFMVGLAEGNLEHPVIEIQNPKYIGDSPANLGHQFGY